MPGQPDRPMFIPLKRKWFEAFERGQKTAEFRRYCKRWDESACRIGRRVVLSLGYSGRRLYGVITGYRRAIRDSEIYGPGADIAEIDIQLDTRCHPHLSASSRDSRGNNSPDSITRR